jgi:hypothetical protein
MRTLQIGNDTKKQLSNVYVDNININGAVSGAVAPETTITSGPTGTVNDTSASFSFTSSAGGSTFSCSLDGGAGVGCTSPTPYSGLAEGSHTFTVAATASGLTDPTPASRTWTIDITPPSITSTVPTDQAVDVAVGTTVQATFSEAMAAGTITGSSFTLVDTTAGGTPVAASVSYNSGTQVATLTPTAPLAAGHTYTATVKGPGGVTDAVGNAMVSDVTFSFTTLPPVPDTTPPTVSLTAPPNGGTVTGTSVTISANAGDNVAVDHVDFLVGGNVVGSDSTNPYSITWDSTTVPDGPVTITAHAVDTSTNSADSSRGVTVSNSGGGGPLFSDDFESGSLGAWTLVKTGADGTATVQTSVVKTGTYAARLTASSTSGSLAYARKTLAADQTEITVSGDFQITAEGTSAQNVPLVRLFDAGGTRRVSLYRQSASANKIYIGYNGTNYLTTGLLPLGTWGHFDLHVIAGTGTATIEVRLNGTLIYSSSVGTVPAVRTIQIGNETSAQPMGTYVDNVTATTP